MLVCLDVLSIVSICVQHPCLEMVLETLKLETMSMFGSEQTSRGRSVVGLFGN